MVKEVTELDNHHKMTVKEVLAYCRRQEYTAIVVVGEYADGVTDTIVSRMTNKDVLWFSEVLRRSTHSRSE
jgi:hypothetical protein